MDARIQLRGLNDSSSEDLRGANDFSSAEAMTVILYDRSIGLVRDVEFGWSRRSVTLALRMRRNVAVLICDVQHRSSVAERFRRPSRCPGNDADLSEASASAITSSTFGSLV